MIEIFLFVALFSGRFTLPPTVKYDTPQVVVTSNLCGKDPVTGALIPCTPHPDDTKF